MENCTIVLDFVGNMSLIIGSLVVALLRRSSSGATQWDRGKIMNGPTVYLNICIVNSFRIFSISVPLMTNKSLGYARAPLPRNSHQQHRRQCRDMSTRALWSSIAHLRFCLIACPIIPLCFVFIHLLSNI